MVPVRFSEKADEQMWGYLFGIMYSKTPIYSKFHYCSQKLCYSKDGLFYNFKFSQSTLLQIVGTRCGFIRWWWAAHSFIHLFLYEGQRESTAGNKGIVKTSCNFRHKKVCTLVQESIARWIIKSPSERQTVRGDWHTLRRDGRRGGEEEEPWSR